MFGCTYVPDGSSDVGVVICPSLYAESLANYRAEVLLARQLASRGVWVARFHYRGTGHSYGDARSVTLQSMHDDAREVAGLLRTENSVKTVGFMGARWGGLVAASSSADEGAPIALWEPTTEPRGYFREVNRFRLIHEMQRGIPGEKKQLEETLEEKGSFEILGYELTRTLYDSARGADLLSALGTKPRSVLLVQLAQKKELRRDYRALVSTLEERGSSVRTAALEEAPVWWLLRPPIRTLPTLVKMTADWFASTLKEGRAG